MMRKKQNIVLDISSTKIVMAAAALSDVQDDLTLLGCYRYEAQGIKSSMTINSPAAQEAIAAAIVSLEQEVGIPVREVVISICPSRASSDYVSAKVKVPGLISAADVNKLVKKALADFVDPSRQVIHYFPVEFNVDQNPGILNPIGMVGDQVSCNLHVISVDASSLNNLVNCLHKCHVKVGKVILASYASALACLPKQKQQSPAIVIDFGAYTTSFVILLEGRALYTGFVPVGSWHISSDISQVFAISLQSAEILKTKYGASKVARSAQMIALNQIDSAEFAPDQVMNVVDLTRVINARVHDIFHRLKSEYDKLNIDELVSQNITITGGGSQLFQIAETVSEIFGKAAQVSYPSEGGEVAQGMIRFLQIDKQMQDELSSTAKGGMFSKVWGWLKESL